MRKLEEFLHGLECRYPVISERPQGGHCLTGCRNKSGMTAWRNVDKSIESDPIDSLTPLIPFERREINNHVSRLRLMMSRQAAAESNPR